MVCVRGCGWLSACMSEREWARLYGRCCVPVPWIGCARGSVCVVLLIEEDPAREAGEGGRACTHISVLYVHMC